MALVCLYNIKRSKKPLRGFKHAFCRKSGFIRTLVVVLYFVHPGKTLPSQDTLVLSGNLIHLIRVIDSGVQSNLKTPCFRTPRSQNRHGYRYVQIQCLRSEMKKSLPPFLEVRGYQIRDPCMHIRIRTNQRR
jgi:hypothetical protein